MKAEIDSMYDRSRAINRWYVADFEKTFECMYTEYIKELSTHKVKLENLLCETDLKEQDHFRVSIFWKLLFCIKILTICDYDKLWSLPQSEKYEIIKLLLQLQSSHLDLAAKFRNTEILGDQERYLKMAIKIEPKDPTFLEWNENDRY